MLTKRWNTMNIPENENGSAKNQMCKMANIL